MIKCRFTILELLVVIAVISILAALLLPALNSARETARGARCLSNIKQVNTALTAYTVDFTFYPWPFRTAENIVMEQRIIEAGYMKPLRRGAQTYKDRFEVQCDSLRDLVCAEGSTYPVSSYIPNCSNTWGGVLTAGSHGIILWIAGIFMIHPIREARKDSVPSTGRMRRLLSPTVTPHPGTSLRS